MIKKNYNHTTF